MRFNYVVLRIQWSVCPHHIQAVLCPSSLCFRSELLLKSNISSVFVLREQHACWKRRIKPVFYRLHCLLKCLTVFCDWEAFFIQMQLCFIIAVKKNRHGHVSFAAEVLYLSTILRYLPLLLEFSFFCYFILPLTCISEANIWHLTS